MYSIQFVKYPAQAMWFALYHPRINGSEGRKAQRYADLIGQVSEDLRAVPRGEVSYAFNSHFPARTRSKTAKLLGLEAMVDTRRLADVIPFPSR